MALTGSSPTYFNDDTFDAIHVATAGQAITQQTGGAGLDFIVKRGTNLFHGNVRGYFDNNSMESSNVPAQDVKLVRRSGNLVDRTQLKNPNVKVKVNRQGGRALPSVTAANPAFPTALPGLNFAGYDAPFTWNNISPRAGLTYALDGARKTVARASYSRFAGQLDSASVGYMNPSSTAGAAVYRWLDLNSDHLAEANEVQLNQLVAAANGFNPANPTTVTSSNRIDPHLKAPVTQSVVAGLDRELAANVAVGVNYTYTRTTNLLGRQGYPFPLFRTQALGADSELLVLVTPAIDTFRYPDVWDTDLRVARAFKIQAANLRLIGDLFNALNANTALVRNNNVLSTSFNALAQNMSPRIFRVGIVVGF